MEPLSEQRLAQLNPAFAAKVRLAAAALAERKIGVRVVSGFRSAAQQEALYAQGRTAPGQIVTHARAGYSMHNYGLAADIVPFLEGEAGALNWEVDSPGYRAMVAAFKAQGLEWGGDWEGTLGDFDHFQVGGLEPTPTLGMRAAYGDGSEANLAAIWAAVAA